MSELKNERQERFAQALAVGKSAQEAFRLAVLQGDDAIRARAGAIGKGLAENNPITVAMLTEGLLRIARDCEASDAATAKNVARGAYMDVARLNGLIRERSESSTHVVQEITDQPLSEGEWSERYAGG